MRKEQALRTKWWRTLFLLVGLAALAGAQLQAQAVTEGKGQAQTDVSASLFGAFNESSSININGESQTPSNAAGGLLEVRHISKPWFGYEGTYSLNRANQIFSSSSYAVCGVCEAGTTLFPVSANAHEVTGDWVASMKIGNLRPFALAGGGIFFDIPSSGQATGTTFITLCGGGNPGCTVGTTITTTANTANSTKPVFVYGAGVDWKLVSRIGLRLQYRGNLYKAPDLVSGYISTNSLTHTAEPMIGVFFRL